MDRNKFDSGRRTALKGIAGLLAGGVAFTGGTAAGTARRQRKTESALGERVDAGEAAAVAEWARAQRAGLEPFDAWAGATVGEPTTYGTTVAVNSRTTHEPTAYVFPVERRGEAVGYLTVSARRRWAPVLEASTAAPPHADDGRAAAAAGAVDEALTGRLLYDGGVAYGVETTGGHVAHLGTGLLAEASTAAPSLAMEADAEAVDARWAAAGTDVTPTALEDIEGVPTWDANGGSGSLSGSDAGDADTEVPGLYGDTPDPWDEWDGCSPFAAAQVMMYHEGIGLDDIEAREEMVDRLHVLMDTSEDGWTDYLKVREGVTNYPASELDHDYTGHEEVLLSKGLFRGEVDADRPFVLNIPSNDGWLKSDSKGPYSGHSVVVTGYYEYDDTFEVIHQNSWDTDEHWMSYGNWAANTWVTRVVY